MRKMMDAIVKALRRLIQIILPDPAAVARRESQAVQSACCGLLLEVARLDAAGAESKRKVVALALREQFGTPAEESGSMIARLALQESRLTSYFRPVALLNRVWVPEQKAQFVEWLWRVAMADGEIDMYEDQLVRKLADLLYIPHTDFILAKQRVLRTGA
jgi:uncharacterized tellurite resistance protein B-like protein